MCRTPRVPAHPVAVVPDASADPWVTPVTRQTPRHSHIRFSSPPLTGDPPACAGAAYLANSEPPSVTTFGGGLPPSPFNSIFRSSVGPVMVTVRPDVLTSAYFWGACHFIVSGPVGSPARMATGCVPTAQPSLEAVVVSVKRPSAPMRPEA